MQRTRQYSVLTSDEVGDWIETERKRNGRVLTISSFIGEVLWHAKEASQRHEPPPAKPNGSAHRAASAATVGERHGMDL